jgi:hypothetical protein
MPRGSFQQEVYCVIMLNRLLARGMAAALPHVDVFLFGHNFESLEEPAWAIARAASEREGGGR